MKALETYNTRELKKELLTRTILEEIPSHVMAAELKRREELSRLHEQKELFLRTTKGRFVEHCAEFFDLTISSLTGPRRQPEIAQPRLISMAVGYSVLGRGALEIAKLFGRVDHGTVLHAKARVNGSPRLKESAVDLAFSWETKRRKTALSKVNP